MKSHLLERLVNDTFEFRLLYLRTMKIITMLLIIIIIISIMIIQNILMMIIMKEGLTRS